MPAPSLHENNSEIGAKTVNKTMSWAVIIYIAMKKISIKETSINQIVKNRILLLPETESKIMPKRKKNNEKFFCEFCSSVFDTEWAMIAHSTSQHSDLNAIFNSIQADIASGGILLDVTQIYDPTSMDIILP